MERMTEERLQELSNIAWHDPNTRQRQLFKELIEELERERARTSINSESEKIIAVTGSDYKLDERGIMIIKVKNYDSGFRFYNALDKGKYRYNGSISEESGSIDETILEVLREQGYQVEVIVEEFGVYQI
jgi:putative component of toxin-antitoxin plasmid stabilization module